MTELQAAIQEKNRMWAKLAAMQTLAAKYTKVGHTPPPNIATAVAQAEAAHRAAEQRAEALLMQRRAVNEAKTTAWEAIPIDNAGLEIFEI